MLNAWLSESTSVDGASQDTTIHGVVIFLSQVKKAKTSQKPLFNGNKNEISWF